MVMMMKFLRTVCSTLFLLALVEALHADLGSTGELLLGIRATSGGKGASYDALFDLGSANSLASLSASGVSYDFSAISSGLSITYGANWWTRNDLYYGVIGGDTSTFDLWLGRVSGSALGTAQNPALLGGGDVNSIVSNVDAVQLTASTTAAPLAILYTNNGQTLSVFDKTIPGSWTLNQNNSLGAWTYFPSVTDFSVTNTSVNIAHYSIDQDTFQGIPAVDVGSLTLSNGIITLKPFTAGGGGGVPFVGPWNWTADSGNWDSANNWTSNQVASNGYAVGITGAVGGVITNNAATNISSLTFSNSAGSYNLTGTNASQTLTITGGITNNSSANQTISLGLNTTSNQTINAASGNITLSAVSNTAALSMNEASGKAITVNGAITGDGSLIQSGSGTLTLAGANSYAGGTTLNAGTVVAGNSASFGSGTIGVASNATVSAATNITLGNAIVVSNAAVATLNNGGYSLVGNGVISGLGTIALSGAGTTTLGVSNSYSGGTTLNGGSVIAGNNNSFGMGTISVAASSTLVAATANLATTNSMAVASGQIATLNTDSNNWTQTGVIGGGGGISKAGNGTLTVSGVNNYTGTTLVNSGTLQVTGSLAGAGTMTVANGGALAGTGSVGKTTIQSGGVISAGSNGNIGSLSLSRA
jgi:autotransporter-associated beta strand protein